MLRRVHSASGVVPLGIFLCEHLWTSARVLGGAAPFERSVAALQGIPLLPVVEVVSILLPLAFHALYGIVLFRQSHPSEEHYSHTRTPLYWLQRVTGAIVLVFVVVHLWEFRGHGLLHGMPPGRLFDTMVEHLSTTRWGVPWIALGYVLGLAATTFHFGIGLWGFTITWGLARSRQTQVKWASAALGTLLFVAGMMTVVCLATGSRFGFSEEPIVHPDPAACSSATK
jgi:succinate dehydrogenase / fumarate reductase cytochrome b subunit